MSTMHERLQGLLIANEDLLDNQPSEALYQEWAELAKAVSDTMDGFVAVLNAAKTTRDAQSAYFKARRAGVDRYDCDKLLKESQLAEKMLDELVKRWSTQMIPPPASTQISLF